MIITGSIIRELNKLCFSVDFQMDRHKYVKVAYHGLHELSREDRLTIYGNSPLQQAYDEPDYALIDTLFSLAEAYLFAQLVEFRDLNPDKIPVASRYVFCCITEPNCNLCVWLCVKKFVTLNWIFWVMYIGRSLMVNSQFHSSKYPTHSVY